VVGRQTAVDAVAIYHAAAPTKFFQDLRKASGQRAEGGVYTVELTMWMMMRQRLDPKGTLSTTVQDVTEGRPQALLPTHKRLTEGTLSSNTGAISRARQRLDQKVTEQVADRIFSYLMADAPEALPGLGRQVFLLDGSSLDLPATPELRKAYPPAENQHGVAHWPVVRIVVAHDVISGLAMRPCWGPMYGEQAVSEQALAAEGIGRLPAGSVVVADRNFGVFSTA
jgi:putative transposase